MDINTKKLKKNAFRVTKERGLTASRVRVPGGHLDARYLSMIQDIAETYGNGSVHMTVRQGFEIPGIRYEDMDKVNELLQPVIEGLNIRQPEKGRGYPASGTRNISACVGSRVCPYACYDTSGLALRIERAVFPDDLHVKVALTGCPNDCAKVRMHDFGIMGMTKPEYRADRCVSCGACVKACKKKSAGALETVKYRVARNHEKCIGCGECVIQCPTRAWIRSEKKYYRLTLLGRTGKKNPRLGEDFIKWADEESIIKIITNTYEYVREYIDKDAPGGKEHIGYIVDRNYIEAHTDRYEEFRSFVKPFTLDKAKESCGLAPEQVEELTELIHSGKRVSFWWTMGVNQGYEAMRTYQSIINITLMTGNMGRPGAGANSITGQCNAMGSRAYSNTAVFYGGGDFANPDRRARVAKTLGVDEGVLAQKPTATYNQIIEGINQENIKGLWILCTNPRHSWVNNETFASAAKKLELFVVQDIYNSIESAQDCTVFFPVVPGIKKEGTYINLERRLSAMRPCLPRRENELSDYEAILGVGKGPGNGPAAQGLGDAQGVL